MAEVKRTGGVPISMIHVPHGNAEERAAYERVKRIADELSTETGMMVDPFLVRFAITRGYNERTLREAIEQAKRDGVSMARLQETFRSGLDRYATQKEVDEIDRQQALLSPAHQRIEHARRGY